MVSKSKLITSLTSSNGIFHWTVSNAFYDCPKSHSRIFIDTRQPAFSKRARNERTKHTAARQTQSTCEISCGAAACPRSNGTSPPTHLTCRISQITLSHTLFIYQPNCARGKSSLAFATFRVRDHIAKFSIRKERYVSIDKISIKPVQRNHASRNPLVDNAFLCYLS